MSELRDQWSHQNKKGETGTIASLLGCLLSTCAREKQLTSACIGECACSVYRYTTALHIAVAEDQLEIVKHLVAHGAPVNAQDKKNRFTPLMLCLAQQPPHFVEMLQAILKGKPDLSAQDSTGQTILHLAARTSSMIWSCV